MDNARCVILVPVAHSIEPHCDLSLRQLEAVGYTVHRLYGYSAVDRVRNRMATDAVAEGFEELRWIDSDMAFEPQSVERLRSHNLPLVCGLYPTKVEKKLTSLLLPGTPQVIFGQDGGLFEIRYAATGFLLTRRQVYLDIQEKQKLPLCDRKLGKPIVPYFQPLIVDDGDGDYAYLGEDYSFCERARRCGYKILADSTIRLQHIGIYGYSWEDLGGNLQRFPTYHLRIQPKEDKKN